MLLKIGGAGDMKVLNFKMRVLILKEYIKHIYKMNKMYGKTIIKILSI